MAILGRQIINIGIENQALNSDSLYTAFHKIENNFGTLFNSASSFNTFQGDNGIGVNSNAASGTVTITNTGVTKLVPGSGITLSGSNGNVVISVSGKLDGNLVAGVTNVGISSNTLSISNTPVVSSGIIKVDLPNITNLIPGNYSTPKLTVDQYGRITNIESGLVSGTVTSVAVSSGPGIAVTGSPVTTSGIVTVTNTGVLRLKAGPGVKLSSSTGNVTISAETTTGVGTVTRVGITSSSLIVIDSPITTAGTISVDLPSNISVENLIVTGNTTLAGNTISSNIAVTGKTNLGAIGNVKIAGGTNGYVLQTDGTGNLSWTAPAVSGDTTTTTIATAGGSDTQIQFNDAGSFNGNSGLTFNKTTGILTASKFAGNGAALTNIAGSSITGNIPNLLVTSNATIGANLKVLGNSTFNYAFATTPNYPSDDTSVATTSYVNLAVAGSVSAKANINSPTFTGIPSAPTPSLSDNSTQIATTAFVKAAMGSGVPTGVILMWSGSIPSIPSGWRLCDGTNNTPDLRDRFVVGASSTGISVGATGGSKDAVIGSHTHTASFTGGALPEHTHSVTDPGHTHTGVLQEANDIRGRRVELNRAIGKNALDATGNNFSNVTSSSTTGISIGVSVNSASSGTPAGTVTINSTGGSLANANMPPYYALCFIMKV